jgi:hypothetical protein
MKPRHEPRHVLAAVVLVGLLAAPALAAVEDEPRFETYSPDPRLDPGDRQTVVVELVNDADDTEDRVPTATNVRVEARSGDTPFEIVSGSSYVGRMGDGEVHTVDVRLNVPEDTPGGTYRLPLRIDHEFEGDERERDTEYAQFEVPERPRFAVSAVGSSLMVHESGTVEVNVSNVGTRAARATSLALTSPNPALTFDGSRSTTVYLGNLSAGASRTATVTATAGESADDRPNPIRVQPSYRDRFGIETQAARRSVNVSATRPQRMAVDNASLSLYGTTGVLSARLVNRGPATTSATTLSLNATGASLRIVEGSIDVGRLEAGESAAVSATLSVDPAASSGPHRLSSTVRYDRGGERRYRTRPTSVVATVPENRDRFAVETVNGTLEPDASNAVDLRLTNEGDAPIDNVRARLAAAPPYESDKPTAYAGTLDPGESAALSFEVTAPEDAVPGTDSLSVNVTGEAPDGRTFFEDGLQATVTYPPEAAAEQGVFVLVVGAVVVFLVLVTGAWWLRH